MHKPISQEDRKPLTKYTKCLAPGLTKWSTPWLATHRIQEKEHPKVLGTSIICQIHPSYFHTPLSLLHVHEMAIAKSFSANKSKQLKILDCKMPSKRA